MLNNSTLIENQLNFEDFYIIDEKISIYRKL